MASEIEHTHLSLERDQDDGGYIIIRVEASSYLPSYFFCLSL